MRVSAAGKRIGKPRVPAGFCTAEGANSTEAHARVQTGRRRKLSVVIERRHTYCHILRSSQQSPRFFFFFKCPQPAGLVAAALAFSGVFHRQGLSAGIPAPPPHPTPTPPADGGQSRARGHLQSEAPAARKNIKDLTGLDGSRTEGVGARRWNEKVGSHQLAF